MKPLFRRIGYGILLWAIPYIAAIALMPLNKSDPLAFKALEISIATATMAGLVICYFDHVRERFFREAILLATTLVVTNWILDFIGLLPFTHQSLPQYFLQIGVEYAASGLLIAAFGFVLEKKAGAKR